jgi:hypothetical protein
MPHFKARVSSGMLALTSLLQRELTSECNHTHRHTQFWHRLPRVKLAYAPVERVVIALKPTALVVELQNHNLVKLNLSAIGVKKQAKEIIIATLQLTKNDGSTTLILAA